ncbi:MAG: hypothetical protein ABR573_02565 [Candidatus Dormibacteria bacterium]
MRQLSERRIEVTYGRGVIEALHHVDVDETGDEVVVVTAWVGTSPNVGAGFHTLQSLLEVTVIDLGKPLRGRRVVDGAVDAIASPPTVASEAEP